MASPFADGDPEFVLGKHPDGTTRERWFHRLRPHTRPADGSACPCRVVEVPRPEHKILELRRR